MSAAKNYLDEKSDDREINLITDGVEVSKIQLLLSDDEYRKMSAQFLEIVMSAAENQTTPNRKRRVFSYVFIPIENRG